VVEDVASLPKLEELHLQLVALSANDIQKLKKTPLRTLGINAARIDESVGAVLGELPHLEELVLERCAFPRGLDATFVPMPRVKSLYIDDDKGNIPSQFRFVQSYPQLQRLWIVRIEVDEERLARIDKLRNLEELSLQFTGVNDDGLRNLKSLTKLRRLFVGNEGEFTGSGLRHLEGCKDLEELTVFSTSFDDAAAGMLPRFPKLSRFVAYDTRLTDTSVESLLKLKLLKLAWLSDTKISQMSIARLKRELPECEFK
jgi:Leucine-rich repeat (LRR) protein